MASPLSRLELLRAGIKRGSELRVRPSPSDQPWGLSALLGRLTLLCGNGRVSAAAAITAAAQRHSEPSAWLVERGFEPYGPDLEAAGVALESLILIRLSQHHKLGRAADLIARTGGVGLVVVDSEKIPHRAMLRRLANHAEQHRMAALILCDAPHHDAAISLVAKAEYDPAGEQRLTAMRDRNQSNLWQVKERYDAVPGCP